MKYPKLLKCDGGALYPKNSDAQKKIKEVQSLILLSGFGIVQGLSRHLQVRRATTWRLGTRFRAHHSEAPRSRQYQGSGPLSSRRQAPHTVEILLFDR